jgi:hypothetical protein
MQNFDANSAYERGEMVTTPDGRVVEAMGRNRFTRNLLRCAHRMTKEEKLECKMTLLRFSDSGRSRS